MVSKDKYGRSNLGYQDIRQNIDWFYNEQNSFTGVKDILAGQFDNIKDGEMTLEETVEGLKNQRREAVENNFDIDRLIDTVDALDEVGHSKTRYYRERDGQSKLIVREYPVTEKTSIYCYYMVVHGTGMVGSRMRGFLTPRKSFMKSFKREHFGDWERVDHL